MLLIEEPENGYNERSDFDSEQGSIREYQNENIKKGLGFMTIEDKKLLALEMYKGNDKVYDLHMKTI